MAEMKDKEYLQECLDETGNILFQLKNNEKKLQDDREILLDDLEQEQEVRTPSSVNLDILNDGEEFIVLIKVS